jgi:hypothetical protein
MMHYYKTEQGARVNEDLTIRKPEKNSSEQHFVKNINFNKSAQLQL